MSIASRRRQKEIKRGQYDFTAMQARYQRQGRPCMPEYPGGHYINRHVLGSHRHSHR